MAEYKSKKFDVPVSAQTVFDYFSSPSRLQEMVDKLPADVRGKFGELRFTDDSINIQAPMVGEVVFKVKERVAPSKVVLSTTQPMALDMNLNITPEGDAKCQVEAAIDVDLPAMLRPMVGPKIQEIANQFGGGLTRLFKGMK